MNARRHRWLGVAAAFAALAGCSDAPAAAPDRPQEEDRPYVELLDSDTDPDQMKGEPGAYAMTARGEAAAPLAVVDVPEGFANFGFFAIWPQAVADEAEPFQGIQYWTVHGVHPDPCPHPGAAPEIGDSVDALVDALDAQRTTTMSAPEPVSLGGHDGVYVELTIPSDVRFAQCRKGYFTVWDGAVDDAQHAWNEPGLDRLWIIDVDGVRVVLLASTSREATDAQADALEDIVTSVRFVEPT